MTYSDNEFTTVADENNKPVTVANATNKRGTREKAYREEGKGAGYNIIIMEFVFNGKENSADV